MKHDPCREEFDLFADEYDEIVLNELQYTAHRRVAEKLLPLLQELPNAHILDLGCGTGLSSDPYFEAELQVTGVDFSAEMIKEAKKRPFSKLFQRDLNEAFKLGQREFEAIIAIGVLDFIAEPVKCLEKMLHYLKDGGYLALTAPLNQATAADFPVNSFTLDFIITRCQNLGCQIVWQDTFLGYETPEDRVEFCAVIAKYTEVK